MRQGSGIQASPRKARKPASRSRSSASERARTFSGRRQRGDLQRLVAGQRHAVGRDDDVAARPAVHAGARAIGVVVGAHEEDLDLAAQPLARGERDRARLVEAARDGSSASRLASAQPRYCVLASSSRSAPIRSASATNSRDARDVAAVEDDVERERQPERARRRRRPQLGLEAVAPGDPGRACGSLSCTESCRLSSPAAASRARRAASAGMPLVIRLT